MALRIQVKADTTFRFGDYKLYCAAFGNDKRTMGEVVGRNGSKTYTFGFGTYDRTSATHRIGC